MKYLRLFQTVAEKEAAELDYPNVNYTIENDSIEILESAPVPPVAFGGLTVKYYIEDPTVEVTLFNGGGGSSSSSSSSESGSGGGGVMPTRMIVDDNEETPINTWRFETAGEHVVQYEFDNNIVPQNFLLDNPISTEVIIGDDITEIGQEAIINTHNEGILTSATIGTGITRIGTQAFVGNPNMTSITVKALEPPILDTANAFDQTNDCPIYVPSSIVDIYKDSTATGWSTYASRIQPIS